MRPEEQPRATIAVVMATYNQARLLERGLASIAAQTRRPDRTVVVDDGSTDTTPAVLAASRLTGLDVIRQANQGVSAARNAGLAAATADYVLFLDDDDSLDPAALERLEEALALDSRPDAVHCDWDFVSDRSDRHHPQSSALGPDPLRTLVRRNPLALHCVLVRRDTLLALGGFRPRGGALEDWELWLRMAANGARFRHLPEVLAHYHWRPGSGSSRVAAMHEVRLAVLAEQRAILGERLSPADWNDALATAWMDHAVNLWRADNAGGCAAALAETERYAPGLRGQWETYYRLWRADYLEALGDRGPEEQGRRWTERERRMRALLSQLPPGAASHDAARRAQVQALREDGRPAPALATGLTSLFREPKLVRDRRFLRLLGRCVLELASHRRRTPSTDYGATW